MGGALLALVALAGGALWWLRTDGDSGVVAGPTELVGGLIPVRANITTPPGEPIADGFEVADGSLMVGYPLPNLYWSADKIEDDGWTAYFVVTEPGRAVLDRYLQQARELGFPVSGPSCRIDRGIRACGGGASEGLNYKDGYTHGRSIGFELMQGRGTSDHPPLSSIVITYRVLGDPPYPPAQPVEVAPEPETSTVPADWPPLPEVGEEFWADRPFKVVPGTILLAHPTSVGTVFGSGTTSLFEVTGDPEKVLDAFWDQRLTSPNGQRLSREERGDYTWSRDGVTIRVLTWTDGKGQAFRIWKQAGRPPFLVVETTPSD